MSLDIVPRIYLLENKTYVEITDSVIGASFERSAYPGEMGTSSAVITLLNNDGKFTPEGSGAFSSYDWFAGLVKIEWDVPTFFPGKKTVQMFTGVVTNFDIEETTVQQSTVTIQCADLLTVAARGSVRQPPTIPAIGSVFTFALQLFNSAFIAGVNVFDGARAPKFESQAPAQIIPAAVQERRTPLAPGESTFLRQSFLAFQDVETGRIADVWAQTVLPSGPASMYAIDDEGEITIDDPLNQFNGQTARHFRTYFFNRAFITPENYGLTGLQPTGPTLTLSTNSADPDAKLANFERGFNLRELVNSCEMRMPAENTETTIEDATSIAEAGERGITFRRVGDPYAPGFFPPVPPTDRNPTREQIIDSKAAWWVKRLSTKRYAVNQIRLNSLNFTASLFQSEAFTAAAKFPFHRVEVDGEPYVTLNSRVSMSPTGIRVTAKVIHAGDMASLLIGENEFARIGKMRIG